MIMWNVLINMKYFKLANLEIHVVDQTGLEGKNRQSAGEGNEVSKEREEASTEGGEGHV